MNQMISAYLKEHKSAYEQLCSNTGTIQKAAEMVLNCFQSGGKVLLCGNGGSAADAQHIAGEFVGRFKKNRQPLPAIALHSDTSVMTCIANDFGYDEVFGRAVEALGAQGDILWAFSTSGSSANILRAAQSAKAKGMQILAFTGKADSPLEQMSDVCFCSNIALTGVGQEMHQIVYHIICDIVDSKYL